MAQIYPSEIGTRRFLTELDRDVTASSSSEVLAEWKSSKLEFERLRTISHQVDRSPFDANIYSLLQSIASSNKSAGVARGAASFLLSQVCIIQEDPPNASKWNRRAREVKVLKKSTIWQAGILCQQAGISLQRNEIDEAIKLRTAVNNLEISPSRKILFRAPFIQMDIDRAYEESGSLKEMIEPAQGASDTYKKMLHARYLFRERRFLRAYDVLETLFDAATDNGNLAVLHLRQAETLFEMNRLNEAMVHFEKAFERFSTLPMHNGSLRATIGIADVHRVLGQYSNSEAKYTLAISGGTKLGLGRIIFAAELGLATLLLHSGCPEATVLQHLDKAGKYLSGHNVQELCLLTRRRASVDFHFGHSRQGRDKRHAAVRDIAKDNEEGALLSATLALPEAWAKIRRDDTAGAESVLLAAIEDVDREILLQKKSVYCDEPWPYLLMSKLWRTLGYAQLRHCKPGNALLSLGEARDQLTPSFVDPDKRLWGNAIFLEGLAYAQLGSKEQMQSRFSVVHDSRQHLGIKSPIKQLLHEYQFLDRKEIVEALAFTVFWRWPTLLQDSSSAPYLDDLASFITPAGTRSTRRFDFGCRTENQENWHNFVQQYTASIRSDEGKSTPAIEDLLNSARQSMEHASQDYVAKGSNFFDQPENQHSKNKDFFDLLQSLYKIERKHQ